MIWRGTNWLFANKVISCCKGWSLPQKLHRIATDKLVQIGSRRFESSKETWLKYLMIRKSVKLLWTSNVLENVMTSCRYTYVRVKVLQVTKLCWPNLHSWTLNTVKAVKLLTPNSREEKCSGKGLICFTTRTRRQELHYLKGLHMATYEPVIIKIIYCYIKTIPCRSKCV